MIRGNSGSGIVNANKSRTSDKNTIVCTLAMMRVSMVQGGDEGDNQESDCVISK